MPSVKICPPILIRLLRTIGNHKTPFALGLLAIISFKGSIDVVSAHNELTPLLKKSSSQGTIFQDVNMIKACTMFLSGPDFKYTPKWRDCMMVTLPLVTTEVGAISAAIHGSVWMSEHPTDTEFLATSNKAIEAGWKDLKKNSPLYKAQNKLTGALTAVPAFAYTIALTGESYPTRDLMASHIKSLEDAESLLNMPELVHKQSIRRLNN
jgi:hypothetical protein